MTVRDARDPAAQDYELRFTAPHRDLLLFDVHHLAYDAAGRDDLIAPLQRCQQLLVLLRLAALRPDQHEIEDPDDHSDLDDDTAEPAPALTGGSEQQQRQIG